MVTKNTIVYDYSKLNGKITEICKTQYAFAERMGVGVATVRAWINMGILDCICVGNKVYIPFNHIFYFKKERGQ